MDTKWTHAVTTHIKGAVDAEFVANVLEIGGGNLLLAVGNCGQRDQHGGLDGKHFSCLISLPNGKHFFKTRTARMPGILSSSGMQAALTRKVSHIGK